MDSRDAPIATKIGKTRRRLRRLILSRQQAAMSLYLVVASLLAHASFSESLDDVIVLTTKLRIA
jgi:hypothetical protein